MYFKIYAPCIQETCISFLDISLLDNFVFWCFVAKFCLLSHNNDPHQFRISVKYDFKKKVIKGRSRTGAFEFLEVLFVTFDYHTYILL